MRFHMTEGSLTDAIFYGSALETTGDGSKRDARLQARAMLAGEALLEAARQVVRDGDLAAVEKLRLAISAAEEGGNNDE